MHGRLLVPPETADRFSDVTSSSAQGGQVLGRQHRCAIDAEFHQHNDVGVVQAIPSGTKISLKEAA